MKRSTSSICLTGPKIRKPRMYVVVGIVAMLLSSSAWSAQQASAVGLTVAAAGDLDPSFGSNGKVTTDFGGFGDTAFDLVIQPDGKPIAVGTGFHNNTGYDFELARYNTDGSLDQTFGSGGRVVTDFSGSGRDEEIFSATLQTDGRIIAAGLALNGMGIPNFALARYNTDGSLDATFGSGGKLLTDFGSGGVAFDVALQRDNRIVAVGRAFNAAIQTVNFAVARYNTDGTLDSSFGQGGKVLTDFPGGYNDAFAVAIQSDGRIVVAGEAQNEDTHEDFAIARYQNDGSLDLTFGNGGMVTTDFGSTDRANDLVIQVDGRIVAVGAGGIFGVGYGFALARYNTNGSLDPSFGVSGKVLTPSIDGSDTLFVEAQSVAIQPDGRIIAAGKAESPITFFDFGLVRYNSNGSIDGGFGSGGGIGTDFFGRDDEAWGVALQQDGKVVAAGSTNTFSDFALARYDGGVTFDICLQDDSNGNMLQFDSTTGDYRFTDCRKGITLTGTGTVTNDPNGCKITLRDGGPIPKRPDRSLLVQANRCTHAARASIQIFSTGLSFSITDGDITNNTCACR